eukprot:TRINITY_DN53351_c0_g1_i1.p1 TRINITY_DN53351_c0_g1~~TRINITY_DN53351_c0_g1_i1.p1  ORF type:complete len:232 (-),score=27.90 TRINITY_DN53351_c0_g1_i1:60-755(-)
MCIRDSDTAAPSFGGSHPSRGSLLLRPFMYSNRYAIHLHEIESVGLRLFHRSLAQAIQSLPSADTLVLPFGSAFKFGAKIPFVELRSENPSDLDAALGTGALDLRAVKDSDIPTETIEVNYLEHDALKALGTRSLCELLDQGDLLEMYRFLATEWLFGAEGDTPIRPPPSLFIADAYGSPSPFSYEVEIQGLRSAPPRHIRLHVQTCDLHMLPEKTRGLFESTIQNSKKRK